MLGAGLRELAESLQHSLGFVLEAARVVHGPTTLEDKLDWTVGTVASLAGAAAVAYVVAPDEELTVLAGSDTFITRANGVASLVRTALRTGDEIAIDNLQASVGGVPGAPASFLAVPVCGNETTHGVLVLGDPEPYQFDRVTRDAVTTLAANLGIALDNVVVANQLAERESATREVVHRLQEAVRPAIPNVPHADLGVYYLAADPDEPSGGDLYDWQVLPDGDLHLAVIDILGKGVAATKDALAVAHVLRVLVLQGCLLEDVIARADDLLGLHHPDLVATILLGRYTPSTGTLQLAGGGHPPPLLLRSDGSSQFVDAPGTALGWPGAGSERLTTVVLDRRDGVILYTDGLVEARKDILAGLDELAAAASQTARYPATHQAKALVDRALAGAARRDDTLALVLRRRTPPESESRVRLAPFEFRFSPSPASVGLARHFLADWLSNQNVDGDDIDDILLVASELATNAVKAASGDERSVTLRARHDEDAIVLEAEDDGGTTIDERDFLAFDEDPLVDAEGGRGLFVIRALTDHMEVVTIGGRTVVRCVRRGVFPSGSRD